MRAILTASIAIAVAATPTQAAGWSQQGSEIRPGAFIGARLKVPLGGSVRSAPRAGLTIAPTQSRISRNGYISSRIGEGVALDLAGAKPTLALGGVRADQALGLTTRPPTKTDQKSGISTGGWIASGVGTVVVGGLIGFALWVDADNDSSD